MLRGLPTGLRFRHWTRQGVFFPSVSCVSALLVRTGVRSCVKRGTQLNDRFVPWLVHWSRFIGAASADDQGHKRAAGVGEQIVAFRTDRWDVNCSLADCCAWRFFCHQAVTLDSDVTQNSSGCLSDLWGGSGMYLRLDRRGKKDQGCRFGGGVGAVLQHVCTVAAVPDH